MRFNQQVYIRLMGAKLWAIGNAVFIAAILAEGLVLYIFFFHKEVGFLWYNVIGCVAVMVLATILQIFMPAKPTHS